MPDTDPYAILAAYLERDRLVALGHPRNPQDVPRLVLAVKAVLEHHEPGRITLFGALCERHENHRYFSITGTEAEAVRACQDCTVTVYQSCAGCGGPQVNVDLCPVRGVITRELTGQETDQ